MDEHHIHGKQFLIRSSQCTGTATDFVVNVANLLWTQDNIFRIVPRVIMCPNTVYNVTASNDRFVVDGLTYIFPHGYYTLNQWITTMNTLLPVGTFTSVVPDPVTGCLVFTSTVSHTIIYSGTTMSFLLGLTADVSGTTLTMQNLPSFNFPNAAYMYIDWAQSNTLTESGTITKLVDMISLADYQWGQTATHVHNDVDIHSVDFNDTRNFSSFRVYMQDRFNNPLVLAPGSSVDILFKFYIDQ